MGFALGFMTILVIAILHSNPQHLHYLQKHRVLPSQVHPWAGIPTEPYDQLREAVRIGFVCSLLGTHILALSAIHGILKIHQSGAVLGISLGVPVSFILLFPSSPRRWERAAELSPSNLILALGFILVYMAFHTDVDILTCSPVPGKRGVYLTLALAIFGSAAYIAVISCSSALKDIPDLPRALATVQISETVLYAVTVIVVYLWVRPDDVVAGTDPAAPRVLRLCDGIAIPTLVVGGAVDTYMAATFFHRQMPRVSRWRPMPLFHAWWTLTTIVHALGLVPWVLPAKEVLVGDLLELTVPESYVPTTMSSLSFYRALQHYVDRHCEYLSHRQRILFYVNLALCGAAGVVCGIGILSSVHAVCWNLSQFLGLVETTPFN